MEIWSASRIELGPDRQADELLEVEVVGGVLAAVDEVHQGNREHVRVGVERAVERLASGGGSRPRRGERDAEDRVGAEALLAVGAIELDQGRVELALLLELLADERIAQFAVYGSDGSQHAETAEARAAITEFSGLHRAGGAARGDVGSGDGPVVEGQIHLHRGQPTAVEDFASAHARNDGTHTITFSPVFICHALVKLSAATVRWTRKRSSTRSASPARIAAISSSCSAATSAGRW